MFEVGISNEGYGSKIDLFEFKRFNEIIMKLVRKRFDFKLNLTV